MKWKELEISCGFGGGEETQRFGPREESGSCLYQVDTVATISNKSEETGLPWMLSTGSMEKVAVVIENHILLFDDCCSNEICSFDAEDYIDDVCWSADGTFLVFVDRSGWLSLAHMETAQVIFSKNLVNDHNGAKGKCFSSVVLSKVVDNSYDLIVVTLSGNGFRFTGLDLDNLNEAILANDLTQTETIQGNIKLGIFDLECNTSAVTLAKNDGFDAHSLLVMGEGDFALSEWVLPEDGGVVLADVCTHVVPNSGFKKCLVSPDGLYLIVLDTMNQVSLWSRYSFHLIEIWNEVNVDDFILFLTNSVQTDSQNKSQAKEDLKIVLLTCVENGKRDLIVLSLPNFEHVYSLKVSSCAILATLPIQQEVIMFLVGDENKEKSYDDDDDDDDETSSVHVKCLMEAIPHNRFSRLLHSKKFEEAEQFAKLFNLDNQMVYQVKSNYLLDQLAPWSISASDENFPGLIAQLKSCLHKIEDMECIVKCCLRAQLPNLEATYDLLNYAREKVRIYLETRKFRKSSDLFQELLCGINRLVTFETAFGSTYFSGATWSRFLISSLIDEVIKCFSARNMSSGFVIWRRHQSEFEPEFNLKHLNALLNSIHESTPSSKLIPWLRDDFVPFVLTILPEGQGILAGWLEKTARSLEFSAKEKENWPDNALEMAEVMFTVFSSVTQSTQERDVATPIQFATKICKLSIPYIDNTADDDANHHASSMKKLGNLVKSLREVKSLHHEYNCKLSLDQFSKEDSMKIVFHLLDRIAAAELIPRTMKKYVRPYILKNNLKVDDLLYEYISMVVDSRTQMASIWEPKVIAIINEIQKKEQKCAATLKLMLKAKTPWSIQVESLIATEMKANPDDQRLERQFQFANLRKMMDGYSIRDTNLADTSKIQTVIRYMISTENPNSVEDALQICEHFNIGKSFVYSEQVQFWVEKDKVAEASSLLSSISKEDLRNLIPCLIYWIECEIVWEPLDDADRARYVMITRDVVLLINFAMKLDNVNNFELEGPCNILHKINCLQVEFGLFLTRKEYLDRNYLENLVQSFLEDPSKYVSKFSSERKTSKSASSDTRLKRFTELLGFDDVTFNDLLIDFHAGKGDFVKIYDIACKLLVADEGKRSEQAKLLYKAVSTLVFADMSTVSVSWVKVVHDIYRCACKSLMMCPEDNLCDNLMLTKVLRIMCIVASQCESIDYQDDLKAVAILVNWVEDYYRDDTLVLSSVDIYPLLHKVIILLFADHSSNLLKYQSNRLNGNGPFVNSRTVEEDGEMHTNVAILEFSKASQTLVKMLKDSNHQELACQVLLFGVSVCSQRTATLQLGINVLPGDDPVSMEASFLTEAELKISKLILEKGEAYIYDMCGDLVNSILSHRIIDHNLALTYLDVFSATDGQQILIGLQNKFKNKYSRIQNVAKVGVDFAALHDDKKFKEMCHIKKECAYWGRKLQLLRLENWNSFKAYTDVEEKKRILQMLIYHKSVDLTTIISFCKFFNYDEEKATFMYIERCMLPSEEDASVDDLYQERIDQCDLSQINNLKALENQFYGMAKKIHSCDYERLTFLFKKIMELTDNEETRIVAEENVSLLNMLSMYKRTANTSSSNTPMIDMIDVDDDQMFEGRTATVDPDVAKTRLPFHSLARNGVTWTVLNPELTSESNVILLKPIVNKLNFDSDQMFARAVRTIATKELAKGSDAVFNFNSVENILNMIQDPMVMLATAKWLVIHVPSAAEKAKVLKASLNRAFLVVSSCPEDSLEGAKGMYKKFNDLYKKASYEAALVDFGITDPTYFRLCNGGAAKLIIQLYEDYGDKIMFETGRFIGAPDIHTLATQIAEISETVELDLIHQYLMERWLPWIPTSSGNEDDEGDVSVISSDKDDVKKENEKNLRRVIYLLASSYKPGTLPVLLKAVYQGNNGSNLTNMSRIRALQVLFTLVDSRSIEVESKKNIEEILQNLVLYMYLSELESLHVSHSEESFSKANKESLVKGLWRNHSHDPRGIRLIADICLDYQIYDPQLWNSLLLKLLSFHMIPYLTHVLPPLSGIPQLREVPSLTKVWKAVITAPFSSVTIPLSPEEESACLRSAQLITRCPVILDIDLLEVASLMKKVGLYMQALFCLKLCPDKKLRKESIHALLEDVGVDTILSKVKKDRDQGNMDPHLDAVEEEVFNYVDEHSLYLKLVGTTFFSSLIEYLINTGKVKNLLLKTVAAGKLDFAKDILSKFIHQHPENEFVKTITEEGIDATNALLIYFKHEKMQQELKPYMSMLKPNRTYDDSMFSQNEDTSAFI